mmetsp:Transcript_156844/g.292681  ORF Transcript_156844/g.292681 Transcript_156844/m.292681 type:complete len:164 (-) Transcript_156844:87-578(-)
MSTIAEILVVIKLSVAGGSGAGSGGAGGGGGRGAGSGGGGGGGERTRKPGDWTCPACGADNFANRDSCFKCGEAKPDTGDFGDGADFFESGGGKYGGDRGKGGKGDDKGKGKGGKPGGKPGDWTCPSCGANNFASRSVCFKCGTANPNGGGGGGGKYGGKGKW